MPDACTSSIKTPSAKELNGVSHRVGRTKAPDNKDAQQPGASAVNVVSNDAHGQVRGRAYSTVFFDLDGTLLPIDTERFMKSYMESIGAYMTRSGVDAKKAMRALVAGIVAMSKNGRKTINAKTFWHTFCQHMGGTEETWTPLFQAYYETEFEVVGASTAANPAAAAAVDTLKRKGIRMAITTMPMFPLTAVKARLRWAGLDFRDFIFVTDYETATSIKPYREYYEEALRRADVSGSEVLMVGNHNREDGGAHEAGCDIYFVTDYLIEVEEGLNVASHKHGSLEDFARFCEQLPEALPHRC